MKGNMLSNRDFLAGAMFIIVGAGAMYMATDYPMGSALRMGPGYFPTVLSGIMMTFGVVTLIRGLLSGEQVQGIWAWLPLTFLTISLVSFGWIMDRFGLIPSLVVMFFTSAYAGHEFKILEVIILTVVMSLFALGVFIWGLGLPYELIKGW